MSNLLFYWVVINLVFVILMYRNAEGRDIDMVVREGTKIKFRNINKKALEGKGTIEKVLKNIILVNAGNYKITLNKADVIGSEMIIQVKLNKRWVNLNREMVEM